MDKLMQIRAFVRIAERASFSAVARELDVTQSSVSKAMTALEKSLGTRLLSRSTRSVALTEAGRHYHERCRQIIADLDEADATVADLTSLTVGTLNIAAPVPFGLMFISSRVARFKTLHPALQINLNLNDQSLNLVEGNIDVAIRLGELNTQGYAVRKLGESPFVTVAAPAYLGIYGTPARPDELLAHNCVVYAQQDNPLEWHFSKADKTRTVMVSSNFRSNNLLVLKDAAIAGVGVARLPLWMVDTEIKAGLLRPVLENFSLPPFAIHAVFPSSRQIPAKVRLFVNFIKEELGSVSYFLGKRG
jgi:DNA-binding transcriptional LysR family regulator